MITFHSRTRYARSRDISFLVRSMPAVRTMKPSPLRRMQLEHQVAQLAAHVVVFDLARHAHAAQRRHQHQVSAGNADVGGKRRPLGADPFLDDLHQHFVAAAEDILDRRLDARASAGRIGGARAAGDAAVASRRRHVIVADVDIGIVRRHPRPPSRGRARDRAGAAADSIGLSGS